MKIVTTSRAIDLLRAFRSFIDPMIIIAGDSGSFIDVNDAWVETTGYSRDELLNSSVIELGVHSLEELQQIIGKIKIHGSIQRKVSFYRKSREWRTYLATLIVVTLQERTCLLAIYRDISERRQMESPLLESAAMFTKAFQCNPDLMAISSLRDGQYVDINDAFVEITGYTREETIGRTVFDIDIWASEADRAQLIQRLEQQGQVRNHEINLRLKSGEIRTFLLSAETVTIDGEPHFINSSRDITERMQNQKAIQSEKERFAKAFNASPVIMAISTMDRGRLIDVNDRFCQFIGVDRAGLLGRKASDFGFRLESADYDALIAAISDSPSIRDHEVRYRDPQGRLRQALYSCEKINIDGENCLINIFADITKQRALEIEMNRLDRLNLVGEMAASIGHEIRNPMTTVRGYLQLMREEPDFVRVSESLDLMVEELDRANSIITEFISLAKDKIVELRMANLNAVIGKIEPLLKASSLMRDHQIIFKLEQVPDILLDVEEIRQLILNLVNNAMESMILPGIIQINTDFADEQVVLSVEDQGHGIASEMIDKLGTPFVTTKEHGTGLGLPTCYRIAARHQARLGFETGATGTTFYVRFPVPDKSSQP
ncbi:MAG: PAS domain S-box protein [Syntrophomonadaceae bacterium]